MNEKGQVTLFVIIAIVILFSVMLIYSTSQTFLDAKLQTEAEKAVGSFIELNSINHYVESCLETVTVEGLTLLSDQGGVIYDYQGGNTPTIHPFSFNEGRDYYPYRFKKEWINSSGEIEYYNVIRNVSYGIYDYVFCPAFRKGVPVDLNDETTSYYPVLKTPIENFLSTYYNRKSQGGCIDIVPVWSSGFLGKNRIPALCSYNGANAVNSEIGLTCKPYAYDNMLVENSMQRSLEIYVKNKLPECVNFSIFLDQDLNISVKDEELDVVATFQTPRGVSMRASYPFEVKFGLRNIVTSIDFYSRLDINIKSLYNYVFQLIRESVQNPYFRVLRDWNNVSKIDEYLPAFELEIYKHPCKEDICYSTKSIYDDMYIITDHSSLIKGRPFSLAFAVKQRKPILDYIHFTNGGWLTDGTNIDLQFAINETISILPDGVDPDDDNVTYTYYGWKEDYDEWFNYSCCYDMTPRCNFSNYQDCIVKNDSYDEKNWTHSQLFRSTNKSSSIQGTDLDVGLHNVTVVIEDEHGFKDFQNVKIFVFDVPTAVINVSNKFADIDNSYASIEDEFILNGSGSKASILADGDIGKYFFNDSFEDMFIYTEDSVVTIYNNSYTLDNATLHYFTREKLLDTADPFVLHNVLQHGIQLQVFQYVAQQIVPAKPDFVTINVTQCFPHVGEDGLDMYPWQIDNRNYTHMCCQDISEEGSLKGPGKYNTTSSTCYEDTVKMMMPTGVYEPIKLAKFDNDSNLGIGVLYTAVTEENVKDNYFPDNYDTNYELSNDVFNVTISQSCSGNRGNVCSGPLGTDWVNDWGDSDGSPSQRGTCADLSESINQFARCEGPSLANLANNINRSINTNDGCVVYSSGESFEKKVFEEGLDDKGYKLHTKSVNNEDLIRQGYCAPFVKSNIVVGLNGYGDDGPYECYGQCGSNSDGDGVCDYTPLDTCECKNGNTVCNDLTADNFFDSDGNKNAFYCKLGDACLSDCEISNKDTTKEGCYCQINNEFDRSVLDTENLFDEFDYFFDDDKCKDSGCNYVYSPGDSIGNGLCCAESTNIYIPPTTTPPVVLGTDACYHGKVISHGEIFMEDNHDDNRRILNCNGQLHYCLKQDENNLVSSMFIGATTGMKPCGIRKCSYDGTWSQ